ncbi:MAG: exopolyphosphatase [Betaproteobacteria bacterium HGW-Betaproteobacteria-11]|nr:MAG: exopolyphosphatase [Betaproteobacteria bacterium HGW-Betaproteobacteria-11]
MNYALAAAVDLGSNSFRLQIGRIVDNQIYPLDGLKETVRLAAGLTADKQLDLAAQKRGLVALARFAERLRGFEPGAVRAVATNTLRVAKNAAAFLQQAERVLGFPIEVIAGREEARLIYLGVAHSLANPGQRQLVVDIGGGSTEFVIGEDFTPLQLESLYMGCVSYSLRFFPNGRVDKNALFAAEMAARRELQGIVHAYRESGWDQAYGSSGTAKSIVDLLEQNGFSEQGITRDGLERLCAELLRAGSVTRLRLRGLRDERRPVLAGGVAIMSALFKEFDLQHMEFSDGALRLGVLYDQLGRYHHEDMRTATVKRFMQRYEVDRRQATRVAQMALSLLHRLAPTTTEEDHPDAQFLLWAAQLHEIGISVAHSSYHKHSAYILANADMPGFSRRDQLRLSRLVLGHRGKLERAQPLDKTATEWTLLFCLRIAALLCRARDDQPLPALAVGFTRNGFRLDMGADELKALPLTAAALEDESRQWAAVGGELRLCTEG